MNLAQGKLSKYSAKVTTTTGMHLISTHILDHFQKLLAFLKWCKGIDIDPEDTTSDTTQIREAIGK
jgi:hypothetical protein